MPIEEPRVDPGESAFQKHKLKPPTVTAVFVASALIGGAWLTTLGPIVERNTAAAEAIAADTIRRTDAYIESLQPADPPPLTEAQQAQIDRDKAMQAYYEANK